VGADGRRATRGAPFHFLAAGLVDHLHVVVGDDPVWTGVAVLDSNACSNKDAGHDLLDRRRHCW